MLNTLARVYESLVALTVNYGNMFSFSKCPAVRLVPSRFLTVRLLGFAILVDALSAQRENTDLA